MSLLAITVEVLNPSAARSTNSSYRLIQSGLSHIHSSQILLSRNIFITKCSLFRPHKYGCSSSNLRHLNRAIGLNQTFRHHSPDGADAQRGLDVFMFILKLHTIQL